MRKSWMFLLGAIVMGACSPQREVVVVPTLMVLPSVTPSETFTPSPVPSDTPTLTATFTETPTETATNTDTPSPTETPTLTVTPVTPTFTPTPSNTATRTPRSTRTPSPTATPAGNAVVANEQGVNLRQGPGNIYAIIVTLDDETPLNVIGRTSDGLYYQAETMDGTTGWALARLISPRGDTAGLPVTWGGAAPTSGGNIIVGNPQNAGGFALGGHVLELNANTVSIARSAGMTWVKMQYRYSVGDSTAAIAGMLNNARANGFRLLVSVVGHPAQMSNFDSYISSYSQFVGEVAALGIDAIEVWNEPNIDREWTASQISGANYTRLLQGAYSAIKGRNPNVMVISGAPAPTGFFGGAGCGAGGCNDDVFMQQMAQAGAAQYMDCVGIHYNEGIVPPAQTSGDPRGEYPTRYFSGMINRTVAAFGSEPICFTELGYLSPEGYGGLPPAFGWAADTSVQEHAQWLGDAVRAARQSGRVQLLIVWNVDFPFWGEDPAGGYAIFRPDGGCPACGMLAAALR